MKTILASALVIILLVCSCAASACDLKCDLGFGGGCCPGSATTVQNHGEMPGMLHCPISASRETNRRGMAFDTADRALHHNLCPGQLFQLTGEVAARAIVIAAQDAIAALIVLPTASSNWQCPPAEAPPLRMRSPVS